jgi:diguanylate cyclase (GGDEF)-like protein
MQALAATHSQSTDRQVLITVSVGGGLTLVIMILSILGQLGMTDPTGGHLTWAEDVGYIVIVGMAAWGGPVAIRELRTRREVGEAAHEARNLVETLFKMTDMLQSALGYADANAVLRATAAKLIPDFGGALYIFNNSGDRLELSTAWQSAEGSGLAEAISPSQCWALKRGKAHLNLAGRDALRCQHLDQGTVALEIPMVARGEVYGLLMVQSDATDGERLLQAAMPVASALADAMSLALSNIALREKLRTQALRDPLTSLYNRRYMEDALERYANLAERSQTTLSVVMFDLDFFKKVNDEHGHAVGDAILTEVASSVVGAIRPCDIACRYGGEEFVILFPGSSLLETVAKAEVLRARIERLSENHGCAISASFGVATIPETSSRVADVMADVDSALYRAKSEGRNRVMSALHRPIRTGQEAIEKAA